MESWLIDNILIIKDITPLWSGHSTLNKKKVTKSYSFVFLIPVVYYSFLKFYKNKEIADMIFKRNILTSPLEV